MSPSRLPLNSPPYPPPPSSLCFPLSQAGGDLCILTPSMLGLLSSFSLLLPFNGPWKPSSLPLPPPLSWPFLLSRFLHKQPLLRSQGDEVPGSGAGTVSWDPCGCHSSFSSWILFPAVTWNAASSSLSVFPFSETPQPLCSSFSPFPLPLKPGHASPSRQSACPMSFCQWHSWVTKASCSTSDCWYNIHVLSLGLPNICKQNNFQTKTGTMTAFFWLQFSRSVMSSSLRPHGLQHTRPSCPSPTPGTCSNSYDWGFAIIIVYPKARVLIMSSPCMFWEINPKEAEFFPQIQLLPDSSWRVPTCPSSSLGHICRLRPGLQTVSSSSCNCLHLQWLANQVSVSFLQSEQLPWL